MSRGGYAFIHCPAVHVYMHERGSSSFRVFRTVDVPRADGAFQRVLCLAKQPLSQRALEDVRQTDLIQQAWSDSGKVYGYRKLNDDLRDAGETCCENRVARLASLAGITAQIDYKHRPGRYGGKPAVVATTLWTGSSRSMLLIPFGL